MSQFLCQWASRLCNGIGWQPALFGPPGCVQYAGFLKFFCFFFSIYASLLCSKCAKWPWWTRLRKFFQGVTTTHVLFNGWGGHRIEWNATAIRQRGATSNYFYDQCQGASIHHHRTRWSDSKTIFIVKPTEYCRRFQTCLCCCYGGAPGCHFVWYNYSSNREGQLNYRVIGQMIHRGSSYPCHRWLINNLPRCDGCLCSWLLKTMFDKWLQTSC